MFEASALKLPFIEEALAAGANLHHISFQHHNSDWTVVSFTNAKGTYLVNGDDVYVCLYRKFRLGEEETIL